MDFTTQMGIAFLGGLYSGYTGDLSGVSLGMAPAVDSFSASNEIQGVLDELLLLNDNHETCQLLLPRIAEKYAASFSKPNGRITVDIDECWGTINESDYLLIHNGTSRALENCTIQVELVGASGESRKNIHFVRNWPGKSSICARYSAGQKFGSRDVAFRTTVYDIQKATVTIWSPKYTTAIDYVYEGKERDRDIAEACKNLSFSGKYLPFSSGIFWNTQRGVEFTHDGLDFLPPSRAEIAFKSRTNSKSYVSNNDTWLCGNSKTFRTAEGQLNHDPNSIELTLSFPRSEYRHKVTLNLGK